MACISSAELAKIGSPGKPQRKGLPCVLGTLSIWLQHAQSLVTPLERECFELSAARGEKGGYAWRFANLNLFTYLIRHRDGRKSNFLSSFTLGPRSAWPLG